MIDRGGAMARTREDLIDTCALAVRVAAVVVCSIGLLITGASTALAAAPTYDLQGTWSSGPLEGGVRQPANGTQVVTQMNMTTGEFSGHSEVNGTQFELKGVESGTALEYTQTEGSYVAHDKVPMLSVLPDGNVGGNGSFEAGEFWMEDISSSTTAEKEAKEKQAKEKEAKEKAEKENARKATVEVTCTINTDGSKPSTCTAQVGGANPAAVPTGTVRFSTTLGSFLGSDTCTLARGSGNTAFCAVEYAPPPEKSIIGTELPIKAAYSGDSNYGAAEGAFKLHQMGIQAEEFEDERINREACEADNDTTVEVNEKTDEVTVPYNAPGEGVAQAAAEAVNESLGGALGGGALAVRFSPAVALASAVDGEGGPFTPITKSCIASLTLKAEGAKKASLTDAFAAKKKPGKGKPKKAKVTIAKANVKVAHAGPVKLHIRLNKAGKKLLALMKRKHKHAHITIKLQFVPPHAK